MGDSTTNLKTISETQGGKATTANGLFDAAWPASFFGRKDTSSLLTWNYYGGRIPVNGTMTLIADGTVTLTASATNYVEVDRAGTVSRNTTGFSADKAPLYKVVVGAAAPSSWEDHRNPWALGRLFYARVAIAMADANKTPTMEQAQCSTIELTGALTALRDVIVPTVQRQWTIFANVTGGFGVRVKTAAGSGITVADGKRAILECDGTNVVRVTADV